MRNCECYADDGWVKMLHEGYVELVVLEDDTKAVERRRHEPRR